MRESILSVKLLREKRARPRRIRSIWMTVYPGSLIDVENNRKRERGVVRWMRCRVHKTVGDQLWVIPVAS